MVLKPGQTITPYAQLTLPNFGSSNWNVPLNSDLTLIDTAFGQLQVPYRGAWSSTAVYSRGEQVSYSGMRPAGVRITSFAQPSVPGAPVFGWGADNANVAGWGTGCWIEPLS